MAHEILSVKLYELDKKIGRIHGRIQLSETADRASFRRETEKLRRECEENRLMLQNKLKYSRAKNVAKLYEAYEEMEQIIRRTRDGRKE